MKQTLLLVVLTLGMCSIYGNAQTKKPVRKTSTQAKVTKPAPKDSREYQVGDDGFEWYRVCKNGKFGAEDKNGNIIVPAEYNKIEYQDYVAYGFRAKMGEYYSFYNINGQCIIPFTRHYTWIVKCTKDKDPDIDKFMRQPFGTWYNCQMEGGYTLLCDISGKEICKIRTQSKGHLDIPHYCQGKFYWEIGIWDDNTKEYLYGIMDGEGNIIAKPMRGLSFSPDKNGNFTDKNNNIIASLTSINTTNNPLANNPVENSNSILPAGRTSAVSSSSNGNSNNNSGTTTVVVEHHRDPVPFQQWQACWACGGMGTMGCDNCGGSGYKYIGDRLHRCSRCNTRGEIPCNICYGNRGQYITVYK